MLNGKVTKIFLIVRSIKKTWIYNEKWKWHVKWIYKK